MAPYIQFDWASTPPTASPSPLPPPPPPRGGLYPDYRFPFGGPLGLGLFPPAGRPAESRALKTIAALKSKWGREIVESSTEDDDDDEEYKLLLDDI
jgi:hypothetical protein